MRTPNANCRCASVDPFFTVNANLSADTWSEFITFRPFFDHRADLCTPVYHTSESHTCATAQNTIFFGLRVPHAELLRRWNRNLSFTSADFLQKAPSSDRHRCIVACGNSSERMYARDTHEHSVFGQTSGHFEDRMHAKGLGE